MKKSKEKLILFTRYPVPGKAKTRLIPELGKDGAADLQEIMTGLSVLNARCFSAISGADIEIRFDGTRKSTMQRWLGKGLQFNQSGYGDLGKRMNSAFEDAFNSGYDHVVIIGCDCPKINSQCLSSAFRALAHNEMVIGPATDGGYYLIALQKSAPLLFKDIDWGTDSVFRQTMAIADKLKLKTAQLQKLSDVDDPQDLTLCRTLGLFEDNPDSISVIIPTLNEQGHIQKAISRALNGAFEVIVADGGSSDNTVEIARHGGASTVFASLKRAGILNTTAIEAKGNVLLFLHADTLLPDNYAEAVMNAVKSPGFSAGAFSLCVDSNRTGTAFIEKMANLRSRLLKLPYGDQALFMKKNTFLRMGGFADMPIMEDYELVKRLGERGQIMILPQKVITSARRWLQLGLFRTTIINQLMIAGFKVGISPEKLANFYRNRRKRNYTLKKTRKDKKDGSTLLPAE